MTPERAKWWDSLPTEEKEIRKIIKRSKHQIHSYKQEMTTVLTDCKQNGWPISSITKKIFDSYKREMRTAKTFIKTLRKQIAMRPHIDNTKKLSPYLCPHCSAGLLMYLSHCAYCGQHLDWRDVK